MRDRHKNWRMLVALALVSLPLWGQKTDGGREADRLKAREHFLQGVADLKASRLESARVQLERSYELWATNPEIAYTLGKLYTSIQEQERAQPLLEQAYRADSTDTEYMQALVGNLIHFARIDEAITLQRSWLKRRPTDAQVLNSLAYSLYAKGEYQEAYDIFEQMQTPELDAGEYARLSRLKIRCLEQMGRQQEVVGELTRLVSLYPELTEVKEELVEMYLDALRYDEALALIEELERTEGVRPSTLQFRLRYLLGKGERERGEALLRQIVEMPDIEVGDKLQMGQIWLAVQSKEEGKRPPSYDQYFERLVALYPESVEARLVYGELMLKAEQYAKALEVLDPLRQTARQEEKLWLMLLQSAVRLEDEALARDICLDAIEALPQDYRFYYYGSMGMYSTRGKKEAMKLLQQGIDRLKADEIDQVGYLQGHLADIYMEDGDQKRAFALYEASLESQPANAEVLNNYAYALSEAGKELDKAERYASQAIKIEKDNASYLDTYAWVLYKRGKYQLAAFWQRKAIEQMDGNQVGLFYKHLGDILLASGDKADAREAYERALAEYEVQAKADESKEARVKRLKSEAEIRQALSRLGAD